MTLFYLKIRHRKNDASISIVQSKEKEAVQIQQTFSAAAMAVVTNK
jgi:hypothetical protein